MHNTTNRGPSREMTFWWDVVIPVVDLLSIPTYSSTFAVYVVFSAKNPNLEKRRLCTLAVAVGRCPPQKRPTSSSIHHGRAQSRRYLQSHMRSNRHILPRHTRRSFPTRARALQTGHSTHNHAYHSGRFAGHDRARNNATWVWRSCTCISAG